MLIITIFFISCHNRYISYKSVPLLALPKLWNLIYVSPTSFTTFQKNSSDMIRELAGGGSHAATVSGSGGQRGLWRKVTLASAWFLPQFDWTTT